MATVSVKRSILLQLYKQKKFVRIYIIQEWLFSYMPVKSHFISGLKSVTVVQVSVPSFENCCETLPYGHLNNKILLYGNLVICGGVCCRVANTSKSGSGCLGFKPRSSCCFLRQGTLLHFVSLHPGLSCSKLD